MSLPEFTEKTETSQESAVRRSTVETETGNGYVSPGGQSELISISAADHDGIIAEIVSATTVDNVDPGLLTFALWIGDDGDTVTFGNARVYQTAHMSGGTMDFGQPIAVESGEKAIVLVNYNDDGASADAAVETSVTYREDDY